MNTIASEWEGFEKAVVPHDAPTIQRREMRLAFYGGAAAILALNMRLADESEEAAMAVLQSLHDEAKAFAVALVAERVTGNFAGC